MATARIHEPSDQLESASVGDASVRSCEPQLNRRFSGRSFVLGTPGSARKPLTFQWNVHDA